MRGMVGRDVRMSTLSLNVTSRPITLNTSPSRQSLDRKVSAAITNTIWSTIQLIYSVTQHSTSMINTWIMIARSANFTTSKNTLLCDLAQPSWHRIECTSSETLERWLSRIIYRLWQKRSPPKRWGFSATAQTFEERFAFHFSNHTHT